MHVPSDTSSSSNTPPIHHAKQVIASHIQFLHGRSFRQERHTYQRILLRISACIIKRQSDVPTEHATKERSKDLPANRCALLLPRPHQRHTTDSECEADDRTLHTTSTLYKFPARRTRIPAYPFTDSRLQGQGRAHHCTGA